MAAGWAAAKHPGSRTLQVHMEVEGVRVGAVDPGTSVFINPSPPPSQGLQLIPPRAFVTFLPGCQSALQVLFAHK